MEVESSEPARFQLTDEFVASPEFDLFIGRNAIWYRHVFERFMQPHRERSFLTFISWNWAAAIFGCLWFAYRKMYVWASSVFAIEIYLPFMLEKWGFVSADSGLDLAVSVLSILLVGAYANSIYIARANETIPKAQSKAHVAVLGGTSVIAAFVALILGMGSIALQLQQ